MTRRLLLAALTVIALGDAGRARAVPQPPHSPLAGITCGDCHIGYATLPASVRSAAAAGSGATSLVDATQSWAPDAWKDGAVTFTSGANQDEFRVITGNTATTLTWEAPLAAAPQPGDTYTLGKTTYTDIETRCRTCHVAGGQASSMPDKAMHTVRGGSVTVGCGKCHDPHNVEPNAGPGAGDLIRTTLRWPSVATVYPAATPGLAKFITGAPSYSGICEGCHTQTVHHRNNASGDHDHFKGQDCTAMCHRHKDGFVPKGCDTCHEAPPPTGAHLAHFTGAVTNVAWGDLRVTADFASGPSTTYMFGCGNCHPMDGSKHGNGVVDVELYNASVPATSLKARHPATASYTPGSTVLTDSRGVDYTLGTCTNVYCHSGQTWTTPGGVPEPAVDFAFNGTYPIAYPPYTVTAQRLYATIGWGDANPGCDGCHAVPLRTAAPQNAAGAGDSHSWIDGYGYENMHAWNMSSEPLQCRTCHATVVNQDLGWTRDGMGVSTWQWTAPPLAQPVRIADTRLHVDGRAAVAFDTASPVLYSGSSGTISVDLSTGTWDGAAHTCSNVGCHVRDPRAENPVKWGAPYRWWNSPECDRCHRMGY
ncbi:MAG TPA: CxxxxCH/CxxCH domain-containing protein [Polyangia bacterium]|jgi:hypothetical protein